MYRDERVRERDGEMETERRRWRDKERARETRRPRAGEEEKDAQTRTRPDWGGRFRHKTEQIKSVQKQPYRVQYMDQVESSSEGMEFALLGANPCLFWRGECVQSKIKNQNTPERISGGLSTLLLQDVSLYVCM